MKPEDLRKPTPRPGGSYDDPPTDDGRRDGANQGGRRRITWPAAIIVAIILGAVAYAIATA